MSTGYAGMAHGGRQVPVPVSVVTGSATIGYPWWPDRQIGSATEIRTCAATGFVSSQWPGVLTRSGPLCLTAIRGTASERSEGV